MRRFFSFLFIFIFLLCGCSNKNNDFSSNFGDGNSIYLSYDNVEKLTNFKCYVSYNNNYFTYSDSQAKELYKLVYNSKIEKDIIHPKIDELGDNFVYLVFYNSKYEFKNETPEINKVKDFYGSYHIFDCDLISFTDSPYTSAVFYYNVDLFDSILNLVGN